MSGGNETATRPTRLSLSDSGWEATVSSMSIPNGSRQRRDTTASNSLLTSPIKKNVSGNKPHIRSNSKRKTKQLSLLLRLQIQLEDSAKAANLALEKQLRRHGRYISRHPIRTLLVACLIITSLFYPAAGIYLWASKGGPGVTRGDARSVWRSLSTPFLDSFASSGRKHHNSLRDLRMIWDDAPDLVAVDARDADAYLGSMTPFNIFPNSWPSEQPDKQEEKCQSVRVEHVFITTDDIMRGIGSRHGALDTPILQSALSLQDTIEDHLLEEQSLLTCVKASHSNHCLTLSPLSFWQQDARKVADDSSPTFTLLNSKLNVSIQGIPLSLMTTLAGRGHLFSHLPRADHLVMTFFLQDDENCQQKTNGYLDESLSKSHEAWLTMLRNITGGQVGILNSEITATKEVVLQFVPKHSSNAFFTQRFLLASAYIAVFVWLCRGLMKIQNVHSRFGLAFTGVMELIISMTLAISICALCGVRLTLVPWEVLPFVVVVIGSESMFVLTNAIISTPIALTVPTRVATGLAKVGVAIAVTVMSDVALMSAIMIFVDVRAVREFCIFAIFSLFVDFFMQMTFFSTVLSIDLQRLELADLLSQGGSTDSNGIESLSIADNESNASDPSGNIDHNDDIYSKRRSKKSIGGSLIKFSCRAVWRARTARTASLSLLLAFMFGIYLYHGSGYQLHHSYPFLPQESIAQSATPPIKSFHANEDGRRFDPFSHLSQDSGAPPALPLPWWHHSPSASFWQALNPEDASSVRIKVEPWTVLSLRSTKTFEGGPDRSVAHFASWAIFRPRVRAFIWFFKLAVLPICGTTGLLYMLLLYLLKDTELLEAQQTKSDGLGLDEEDEQVVKPTEEEGKIDLNMDMRTNRTSHTSDVVLIRQTAGHVVSLATDSSLSVWRPSKRAKKSNTIVLSAVMKEYSRITALEVDSELDLIALGHVSGNVSLWTMSTLQLIEASKSQQKQSAVDVEATNPTTQVQSLFLTANVLDKYAVLSAHRDGSIWKWTKGARLNMLLPQNEALWMSFSPSCGEGYCRNIIALSSSDYRFQLHRISPEATSLTCLLATHESTSVIRCATLSTLVIGEEDCKRGNTWSTAIVGTSRGSVVVYDLANSSASVQYDLLDGPINSIRSLDITKACPSLGYMGAKDVILANSSTLATILGLSGPSDASPTTTTNIARSPFGTSSNRKRNGYASAISSHESNSIRGGSGSHKNGIEPASPKQSNFGVNTNGFQQASLESSDIPFSLAIGNIKKQRRTSSQSFQRLGQEEASPPQQYSNLVSHPPPSASTIGSAHGSVLDHFDINPFDIHSSSPLQWARLASLECVRGGSDLVVGNDGARVIGVRRRARQSGTLDSRWEAIELDLEELFSDRRPNLSVETSCVQRCRLDIEDNLLFESNMEPLGELPTSSTLRSVHFAPPSRTMTPILSFTRLDHIQAFYKERSPDSAKRRKRMIVFTFANCVANLVFYPSSSTSSSSSS